MSASNTVSAFSIESLPLSAVCSVSTLKCTHGLFFKVDWVSGIYYKRFLPPLWRPPAGDALGDCLACLCLKMVLKTTCKFTLNYSSIKYLKTICHSPQWKKVWEPQYCPHSDFMLFIFLQQVLSFYCSHPWDPVNIVTLALCSLWAVQQASVFIG